MSLVDPSESFTQKATDLTRSAMSKLEEEKCVSELPGVGPKTHEKMRDLGVKTIRHLRDRVANELCSENSPNDVAEILKLKLGVRHKRHAKMISDFLNMDPAKEQVEEVQTAGVDSDNNSGIKVAVEGNISSGKSTFLQAVGQLSDNLRSSTHLVPEPVEMWTDDKGQNILEAFSQDPQQYSYAFQSFVFTTRVLQDQLTKDKNCQNRLIERSVFSDLFILIRAVKNANWMSEMEYKLLRMFINPSALGKVLPQLVPDGFIYLRTPPRTCYARLHDKQRIMGAASQYSSAFAAPYCQRHITLQYLEELHWYHDNWFDVNRAQPSSLGGASVASELSRQLRGNIPSQLQSSDSLILTDQRSNFAMGGGTGGCSMHTLVLNSDDDCDINRNVEQVEAFFEFLKENKSKRQDCVA